MPCFFVGILEIMYARGYPKRRQIAVDKAPKPIERKNMFEYLLTFTIFSKVKFQYLSVKAKTKTNAMGISVNIVIQTM